mmetsp:Transcript_13759/g.15187  ORF Transcript_13759/g.15187 Transcript_13759/m.15187 type:complete len:224 (-) Transcript_13759:106-777(-)
MATKAPQKAKKVELGVVDFTEKKEDKQERRDKYRFSYKKREKRKRQFEKVEAAKKARTDGGIANDGEGASSNDGGDEGESEPQKMETEVAAPVGFANAFNRIVTSIDNKEDFILGKRLIMKKIDKEAKEQERKKRYSTANALLRQQGHVRLRHEINDYSYEAYLRKTGMKGVVQLLNTIKKVQKSKQASEDNSVNKNEFLKLLKKPGRAKREQQDEQVASLFK